MLNPISTHGKYGAVNTNNPRKLRRVARFRRLQIYTRVELSGDPRKGIETNGERSNSVHVA
jgi:hypothetical protein